MTVPTTVVSARVTPAERALLEEAARELSVSVSELLRRRAVEPERERVLRVRDGSFVGRTTVRKGAGQ